MVHLSFLPNVYKEFNNGLNIFDTLKGKFRILFCCVPSDSEASIILLFGFRNMSEMDNYFKKFKIKLKDYAEIKKIIPFSYDNLLNCNPVELLKFIIDGKILEPLTIDEFKSFG